MKSISKQKNPNRLPSYPWWRKDKDGWPIETWGNAPIKSFIRILFQNIRKLTG